MNTPVPIAVVTALRERIRCLEGGARHRRAVLPFGIKAIDGRLPEGGLALGALHEVAGGGNGAIDGAAAALFAAGIAARTRGRVLWCVTRQDLFAPALGQVGLPPDRVIFVEAGDEKSVLACFEEGLRHGGLGAVVAEVARLSMTASRRLQLAAEGSGAIGIAIRRLLYMRGGSNRIWHGASATSPRKRGEVRGRSQMRLASPAETPSLPSPASGGGKGGGSSATQQSDRNRQQPTSVGGGESAATSNLSLVALPPPFPPPQAGEGQRGGIGSVGEEQDFGQPTAAVTRWRVSALPSQPLPVPGVGRARWRLELIRCRGGESACFEVEACDAQGRLALPSDLVHGSGQKAIGRRRTAR